MNPSPSIWQPDSWQRKPAAQQPAYEDVAALAVVLAQLHQLPPLVSSWEVESLKQQLAEAQRGERFLLQGGDCSETFADCESSIIASKLKILLQMSLVLVQGARQRVTRVGRFVGQYAKPRSASTETRGEVTLPVYRGDLVNRAEFDAGGRTPDPELLLRGYERAGLTINFIRALVDGGFADLHHPEYWELPFARQTPIERISLHGARHHRISPFLRVVHRRTVARNQTRGFLQQPRGIAPAIRTSRDPTGAAPRRLV
jgi:3-deoxy-7-phosphoheptulonate synthase